MLTMNHYYWQEGDKIVVQNMLMGMEGQRHEHTFEDFDQWKQGIDPDSLINLDED